MASFTVVKFHWSSPRCLELPAFCEFQDNETTDIKSFQTKEELVSYINRLLNESGDGHSKTCPHAIPAKVTIRVNDIDCLISGGGVSLKTKEPCRCLRYIRIYSGSCSLKAILTRSDRLTPDYPAFPTILSLIKNGVLKVSTLEA